MFGKNPILKQDLSSPHRLKVVNIFQTVQGEGPYAGMAAVFVRLHGCNLRCWFCDTEFSNPKDPEMDVEDIVAAVDLAADDTHSMFRTKLVVVTGGEPLRQNLSLFFHALLSRGYRVQVETAGTLWNKELEDWSLIGVKYVVSPKTPSINLAIPVSAFKYVVQATGFDPNDGLPAMSTQNQVQYARLYRPPADFPRERIFLSPMDEQDEKLNAANRAYVAWAARRFGYRAGLQLHKFFGVE